eukprot:PLAT14296.1.p1 GENE.PLAT14296.1~~PLAT14296.1.p1  ORF type:complete len:280 (-),score=131.14 PLAT14296.1:451-1266(-)
MLSSLKKLTSAATTAASSTAKSAKSALKHEDAEQRAAREAREEAAREERRKEVELERKLAAGETHWEGNDWWADFKFYVRNSHPVLSICLVHPKHPYDGKERAIVEGCVTAFAFGFVALFTRVFGASPQGGRYVASQLANKLAAPIVLAIMSKTLRAAAECKCCIGCLDCVRKGAECLGGLVLIQMGVLSSLPIIFGLVFLATTPGVQVGVFIADWLLAKLLSWLYWFAINAVLFTRKRRKEMTAEEGDDSSAGEVELREKAPAAAAADKV